MLKRQQFGYSMIEVLVTIAVLAVLVAAITPSASEVLANMRLRGAAQAVMAGLQKARSEAVKSNQVVSFWLVSSATPAVLDDSCALSSDSASWVVAYDDPSGQCGSDPSTETAPRLVQANNAGPDSQALSVSAMAADGVTPATQVGFDGFGRRPAATAATDISSIDITSATQGSRRLRLQISAVGSIKLCDRDAPVTVPADPSACN